MILFYRHERPYRQEELEFMQNFTYLMCIYPQLFENLVHQNTGSPNKGEAND